MKEIVKVVPDELDSVMEIVSHAIRDMEDNGIHQWDEVYPDRNLFQGDISAEELYCVKLDGVIAGIVALNEYQPDEYGSVAWEDDKNPLVIHRLCIDPGHQKNGFAKLLVTLAESYGIEHGYSSIRLDAFTENPGALGLYDSLRYIRKGIVRFRKGELFCYEKILNA